METLNPVRAPKGLLWVSYSNTLGYIFHALPPKVGPIREVMRCQ